MLRLVAGLVALPFVLLLFAAMAVPPRMARACSAGPDFDPVASSDVIVGGHVISYERLAGPAPAGGKGGSIFTPVALNLEAQHFWKGDIVEGELVIDRRSLMVSSGAGGGEARWAGASGSCGALDDDPTGMYAVFGLSRNSEGALTTNRLTTFYIGQAPYDPAGVTGPGGSSLGLPAVTVESGHGNGSSKWPTTTAVVAMAAVAGAVVAACAAVVIGQRRARPGRASMERRNFGGG